MTDEIDSVLLSWNSMIDYLKVDAAIIPGTVKTAVFSSVESDFRTQTRTANKEYIQRKV